MSKNYCARCGLANFTDATKCKRCKFNLQSPAVAPESVNSPSKESNRLMMLCAVAGFVFVMAMLASVSNNKTSTPASVEASVTPARESSSAEAAGNTLFDDKTLKELYPDALKVKSGEMSLADFDAKLLAAKADEIQRSFVREGSPVIITTSGAGNKSIRFRVPSFADSNVQLMMSNTGKTRLKAWGYNRLTVGDGNTVRDFPL